jgi:hypothetical protein
MPSDRPSYSTLPAMSSTRGRSTRPLCMIDVLSPTELKTAWLSSRQSRVAGSTIVVGIPSTVAMSAGARSTRQILIPLRPARRNCVTRFGIRTGASTRFAVIHKRRTTEKAGYKACSPDRRGRSGGLDEAARIPIRRCHSRSVRKGRQQQQPDPSQSRTAGSLECSAGKQLESTRRARL